MSAVTSHWKRYKEIALLLWKYGRSDLARRVASANEFELDLAPEEGTTDARKPAELADDLERMGPTFIKLGQVLAGRSDLVPPAYVEALQRLQDRVQPFSFAEVEAIIEEELGVRMSKAFQEFAAEPMAAASLGQVHRAVLRNGRPVVVKVQRPGIRRQIAEDFAVLEQVAGFLDEHTEIGERYRFRAVIDEFKTTLRQELDYEQEARNLVAVGRNLEEFDRITIPQPVADYCSSRVLTMDFVRGRKVTELSPLAPLDLDGEQLAAQLLRAYLQQVLVDGLFHADPHPGNVFITDDGRVALLDLGMVGHTSPGMQENLLKLVLAVSEARGEEAAEVVIAISEQLETFNPAELRRQVARLVALRADQSVGDMKVGASLQSLSARARENGLIVPGELTLLGKTLLQLDDVGRTLAPSFNPNAAIRQHAQEIMTQRVRKDLTQGNFFATVMETKHFLAAFPGRMGRILDAVADAKLEVKVKAVDANHLLDGMLRIANRISAGLVLAALIVGAALMMRVETRFTLFGYPGLAILCFFAASAGGLWLVGSILFQDRKSRRKTMPR
jgi:predicted unusual protein kinase regulating ubiquinone biosynthesis (AarF/ABC1/UbiB family)